MDWKRSSEARIEPRRYAMVEEGGVGGSEYCASRSCCAVFSLEDASCP